MLFVRKLWFILDIAIWLYFLSLLPPEKCNSDESAQLCSFLSRVMKTGSITYYLLHDHLSLILCHWCSMVTPPLSHQRDCMSESSDMRCSILLMRSISKTDPWAYMCCTHNHVLDPAKRDSLSRWNGKESVVVGWHINYALGHIKTFFTIF